MSQPFSYFRSTMRSRLRTTLLAVLMFGVQGLNTPASADPKSDRDRLFSASLKHPADVKLALDYVKACLALQDYESAISALERASFYRPDDGELKAQLGLLYYQLGSHQMTQQYFQQAGHIGVDPATQAKIDAIGPAVETGATGSHAFAFFQGGTRYQSNAAFNPDNNILRLANQDFVFTHPGSSRADWNGFQLLQAGYDMSLGNQRGDTLEFRALGYATQQFRFTDLNVGFYDLSVGPRLALSPENLPGWTVKPYAVGGQFFLAGSRYFSSEGGGVTVAAPLHGGLLVEAGVEGRRVDFNNVSVFSSLNSGSALSASLAAQVPINERLSFSGRIFFTRDSAAASYQSSDSVAEEAAFTLYPRLFSSLFFDRWSLSPYVKLLQTTFDGANPYIDDSIVRRDHELQAGLVIDFPISKRIGFVTNLQYATVDSNIPNFRLRNFSAFTGPTVRF